MSSRKGSLFASRIATILIAIAPQVSCSTPGACPNSTRTHAERPIRHAILISIDGLRPDAMVPARATTFLSLILDGAYTDKAKTIDLSETLPSHASMITGLESAQHGLIWNSSYGRLARTSIFEVAHASGQSTAFFYSKEKLRVLANPKSLDVMWGPIGSGASEFTADQVANEFTRRWEQQHFDLALLHIADPDVAGHLEGWMSMKYLDAVRRADEALHAVVRAIRKSSCAQETAIIIVSDHGGHGKGHSNKERSLPENLRIPWLCIAPGVQQGSSLGEGIRIVDTAPTVLGFLGLAFPEPIDGKSIVTVGVESQSVRDR